MRQATLTPRTALLAKSVEGRLSAKDVSDIHRSREPIQLTMHLGDEDAPFEQDPNEPTYHIEVYTDGTAKCYDRYPDGKIEYRTG